MTGAAIEDGAPYIFITNIWEVSHFGTTALSLTSPQRQYLQEVVMGKGILLWLLGVPIPVIIILALLFH